MERTVYVDILFLINFSMDFLCFYLSSRIISVRFLPLRSVAASVVGGIYAVFALLVTLGYFEGLLLDIAVCFLMCVIVFLGQKGVGVIFATLVYFAVSMALGGFMTALFNLLNKMGFASLSLGGVEEESISVWLFALLAFVSAVITLGGGRGFRRRSSVKHAELRLVLAGREKKIFAMVDSGNLLREPISGRACIALDIGAARGLVPDGVVRAAREDRVGACTSFWDGFERNIRLVPTHTATGDKLLIGFRPDKIFIDAGRGEYESDAFVVLSSLEGSASVEALLPSELLN